MSFEKKYESLGVDKEKQQSEPTLVDKAREQEEKQKRTAAISTPEQINQALKDTTANQAKYIFDSRHDGTARLEEALDGRHSQEELTPTTSGPSIEKAKQDAANAKK